MTVGEIMNKIAGIRATINHLETMLNACDLKNDDADAIDAAIGSLEDYLVELDNKVVR